MPYNSTQSIDTDSDGYLDNIDQDDDNDWRIDADEAHNSTDPLETAFTISVILICCYQLLFYRFIYNKTLINSFKGLVYFILYLCTFEIAPIVGIISFLK